MIIPLLLFFSIPPALNYLFFLLYPLTAKNQHHYLHLNCLYKRTLLFFAHSSRLMAHGSWLLFSLFQRSTVPIGLNPKKLFA